MDLSPLPILDAAASYRGSIVEPDSGRSVSADALRAACSRLGRQLASRGLAAGQRTIVSVGNGPEFIATFLTLLELGGSPLLVHAKTPPAELKRTALRFGARWVLAGDASPDWHAELPAAAVLDMGEIGQLACSAIDPRESGFNDSLADYPGVPLHPTSGTTGVPKVALRPGYAAIQEALHYIEAIGVTSDDRIVAVAPMCHAYAYGMCVMVSLVSGASLISLRGFQASRVFQAIEQERATILPAVPAMIDVMMFGAGERLRGAVHTVLTAGSPLSLRTAERFRERTGIMIRPLYGTTETGGITVAAAGQQTAGSCVGPPMLGIEAQVRPHPDHTQSQPSIGRLFIRSSSMMAGYLGPDGIDATGLEDGWFATGDLAQIDPTGRIHLMGREAEIINVEGMKVIPMEVEEVIAALPGIKEVKVYAGQRKSGGQYIKAAVVAEAGIDPPAIRAHCERQLVYYKRPERIIPLAALPRSPAGKILRDQLP